VTGCCTEQPLLEECIAVLMVTKFSFTPSSLFGLRRLVGNLAANGVARNHDPFHQDVIFRHSQSSVTSERLNSIIQATCQCSLISFPALSQPLKLNISLCLECRPYSSSAFSISIIIPTFDIPNTIMSNLVTYTHITPKAREMRCFCKICDCRMFHLDVSGNKTANIRGGCLNSLTKEMMGKAVHIWAKRAVVNITEGLERYEEYSPNVWCLTDKGRGCCYY
jgi:hypothetical protein